MTSPSVETIPAAQPLRINVRHGSQSLQVEVPETGNVAELMEELEKLTGVPPRGQKLIHKGKVLSSEQSLGNAKVINGAKIMLMASLGVHQGSEQGDNSSLSNSERFKTSFGYGSSSSGFVARKSSAKSVD